MPESRSPYRGPFPRETFAKRIGSPWCRTEGCACGIGISYRRCVALFGSQRFVASSLPSCPACLYGTLTVCLRTSSLQLVRYEAFRHLSRTMATGSFYRHSRAGRRYWCEGDVSGAILRHGTWQTSVAQFSVTCSTRRRRLLPASEFHISDMKHIPKCTLELPCAVRFYDA